MKNRTDLIFKQIGITGFYKGFSIIISFLLVPLSIKYLGVDNYGLWVTMFSFISWFSFFDFGIGNGLRNKLSQALANDNRLLAKQLVSTAYFIMALVVLILVAIFLCVSHLIDWNGIFKYTGIENLEKLFQLAFIVFSINLVLKMVTSVYFANQKPSFSGLIDFFSQLIVLLSVYIAIQLENGSLFTYAIIIFLSQFAVLFVANIFSFQNKYAFMAPNLRCIKFKHSKSLFNLGFSFFLIQICFILIYSTDNFIINYYFGPDQVAVLNIAIKYFMIVTMAMSIILTPYWSAFTNAFELSDFKWIKKSFKKLTLLSLIAAFMIIIMIIFANYVYDFWIGDAVSIPFALTVCIGISTFLKAFNLNSVMLINGLGKVRLQLIVGVFGAVTNIPLSIVLAVNCNLGVSGVIIATIITELIGLCFYRIQAIRLINGTAKGIFNI